MLHHVRLRLTMLMTALLLLAVAGAAAAGPFEDAEAAQNRGDYATAIQIYRSLADQGHAAAQLMLGVMYVKGQGVPRDLADAWTWFKRAASNPAADQATRDDAIYNGNLITKRMTQADEEIKKQAVGEVASEMLQCSIWFVLVSTCIDTQNPALASGFRKAAEKVLGLARRAPGFSDEAVIARSAPLAEAMMKSMGGTCTNIAVPRIKYGKFCQRLADDDASQRSLEWVKCIQVADRTCNGP